MGLLRAYAVLIAAIMLGPLAAIFLASATSDSFVTVPPVHWGLRWYGLALAERSFASAFLFSLQTATAVAILAGVLGVGGAIAIERYRFPGRGTAHAALMAPMMLPHIVLAIGLLQLFSLLHVATSPFALVAGHVVIVLPFIMRLTMAGIAGVDPLLELAGQSLGASRFDTLRRVLLPLIAPSVLSGLVFAFLLSFDEAVIAVFTSTTGRTTIPVQILNYAEQRSDPLVAAVSSLMVLVAVGVILAVDRTFGLLRLLSGGQLGQDRG